ncbi:MAG TPA: DUF5317 family protein [Candidatus Acidoferrales bacterium]|nr:DUF5317 family protein [Candidatus Acidoferrales bacterium]
MLLLVGAALGLLGGLAARGSLAPLASLRLRWIAIVPAALVVKELGIFGPLAAAGLGPWLYVASALALIAWVLAHHKVLPLAWMVALGMGMNLFVVLVNGGHMPVRAALAHRGPPQLLQRGVWGQYMIATPSSHLNWLGDTILLPGRLGQILPQAYSVGDLITALGLMGMVFWLCRPRTRRAQHRPG